MPNFSAIFIQLKPERNSEINFITIFLLMLQYPKTLFSLNNKLVIKTNNTNILAFI